MWHNYKHCLSSQRFPSAKNRVARVGSDTKHESISVRSFLETNKVRLAPCSDVCHDFEHEKRLEMNLKREGSLAKTEYVKLGAGQDQQVIVFVCYWFLSSAFSLFCNIDLNLFIHNNACFDHG